ncbi:MAG: hypothetical protein HC786_23220 [Richelia sp. CSU_2_1]|nr:hypothetical protein [Richelia sp. CSU_2_1]
MYLTALEVQQRAIAIGMYEPQNAPSLEQFQHLLGCVEDRLDSWLGYHPARKTYTEDYRCSANGKVALRQYPVIVVARVEIYNPYDPLAPPDVSTESICSNWWRGGILTVAASNAPVKVTYDAGHDPLPERFKRVAFGLVVKGLQETGLTGDLGFLEEPIRDVSSISIPGISKSFRLGDTAGKGGGGALIDRLLAVLQESGDRRMYRFPSS